jgi:predicted Zn-dependent protease
VRLDDGLGYTEPAEWHFPPRGFLAAALLKAGRPREAETIYWDDLKRNAENGWSLFGLSQALAAQGKKDEAAAIEARFKKAWAKADVTLQASVF